MTKRGESKGPDSDLTRARKIASKFTPRGTTEWDEAVEIGLQRIVLDRRLQKLRAATS